MKKSAEDQARVLCIIGFFGVFLSMGATIWLEESRPLNIVMGCFAFVLGCGAVRWLTVPAPTGDEKMWRWPIWGIFSWLAILCFGMIIEYNLDNFGLTLGAFLGWTHGIVAILSVIGIFYCTITSIIREKRHRHA